MINFVVFQSETGKVVRTGFCGPSVAAEQACGDEALGVLVTQKHYTMPDAVKVSGGAVWEKVGSEWISREPAIVAANVYDPIFYPPGDPPLG